MKAFAKRPLTLLAVFAHPDDETFAIGGTLAKYAHEGVHVYLVCATRGEAGELGDPGLGDKAHLGQIREQELRCAARVLGLKDIYFLGYRDSGMAGSPDNQHPQALIQADPAEVVGRIVYHIRRLRPQVVVTFDEGGGYGHPDHVAIHHYTQAAFFAAGDPTRYPEHLQEGLEPWSPQKLYYTALPRRFFRRVQAKLQELGVDMERLQQYDLEHRGLPDEMCTTEIDVSDYVEYRLRAGQCHASQLSAHSLFRLLPPTVLAELLSTECFAREGRRLQPGEPPESDLFAGLR